MKLSNVLIEKSLANCHCPGLDSLVIKDAPRMVRVFVARPEHEMYCNHPHSQRALSIAMHPHHCDVTLIPLVGRVHNVSLRGLVGVRGLYPYRYTSPITGTGHFEAAMDEPMRVHGMAAEPMVAPVRLPAHEYHTVFVPKGETAAWLVFEGDEDPDYNPIVYTDAFLEHFDFSTVNHLMTEERLREDLAIIGVSL